MKPGAFPLGSPHSRAAARLMASERSKARSFAVDLSFLLAKRLAEVLAKAGIDVPAQCDARHVRVYF